MKNYSILLILMLIATNFNALRVDANNLTNKAIVVDGASIKKTDISKDLYSNLIEDIRWFFKKLEYLAVTVEHVLPSVNANGNINSSKSPIRMNLLIGLRHFVVGIKEISATIERVFAHEDVRQHKKLSQVTNFAGDFIKSLRDWFRALRVVLDQLLGTYNFYMPEILLTKCVGKYVLAAYPRRALYEIPFVFINDVISSFIQSSEIEKGNTKDSIIDESIGLRINLTNDNAIEQNEILDSEGFNFANAAASSSKKQISLNANESTTNFNKNRKIEGRDTENVISLQNCIQIYVTKTIMRKLEIYFLQ